MTSGQLMRRAMSEHDVDAPATAAELIAIAEDMETALIADEVQFSDPAWRRIDGLRALAGRLRFDPSRVDELSREHAKALHDALSQLGYCGSRP